MSARNPRNSPSPARVAAMAMLTMLAFAANSAFCRAAMLPEAAAAMHPIWFTAVRVLGGAIVLGMLSRFARAREYSGDPRLADTRATKGSRAAVFSLFAYAVFFSLAYTRLDTGTGALVLFGTVQLTMFGDAARSAARPGARAWLGMAMSMAALGYMLLPGADQPDPLAAASMFLAGVAWGVYSLIGRGSSAPLHDTARAFVGAAPLAVALVLITILAAWGLGPEVVAMRAPLGSPAAVVYALASGVLASGLGYALWYATLPSLRAETAAVIQLSVPVIAAAAGALWLAELPSARTLLAAPFVLVGIALVVTAKPDARAT